MKNFPASFRFVLKLSHDTLEVMDTKVFLKSTSATTIPFAWEGTSGKGHVVNYVWNPMTLALEIQQPSTGGGGTSDATAANQVTGNASLSSIDSKLSSQATAAKQDTGNTSLSNIDTDLGAKADSAATTDTGTFSLIALVKRLLQSLTTGNTSTAAVATSVASIDTKSFSQKVSTSTLTNVGASASSVSLLVSNANRRGAYFYNDSAATASLKLGATASATSFTVKLAGNSYYELPVNPVYTGAIDCIWSSATGTMRITELS